MNRQPTPDKQSVCPLFQENPPCKTKEPSLNCAYVALNQDEDFARAFQTKHVKAIREDIARKTGRYDTFYTLIRSADGTIHVETFESPNKPFQKGLHGSNILPEEFDLHVIDGRSLRKYVEETIQRIDSAIP